MGSKESDIYDGRRVEHSILVCIGAIWYREELTTSVT